MSGGMSTRKIVVSLLAVTLLAGVYLLGNLGGDYRGDAGVWIGRGLVPNVVGMKMSEASRTLREKAYRCAIWDERDGGKEARRVVDQEEKPGDNGDGVVRLTVSKPYPDVAGLPKGSGKDLLPPDCIDQRDTHKQEESPERRYEKWESHPVRSTVRASSSLTPPE